MHRATEHRAIEHRAIEHRAIEHRAIGQRAIGKRAIACRTTEQRGDGLHAAGMPEAADGLVRAGLDGSDRSIGADAAGPVLLATLFVITGIGRRLARCRIGRR